MKNKYKPLHKSHVVLCGFPGVIEQALADGISLRLPSIVIPGRLSSLDAITKHAQQRHASRKQLCIKAQAEHGGTARREGYQITVAGMRALHVHKALWDMVVHILDALIGYRDGVGIQRCPRLHLHNALQHALLIIHKCIHESSNPWYHITVHHMTPSRLHGGPIQAQRSIHFQRFALPLHTTRHGCNTGCASFLHHSFHHFPIKRFPCSIGMNTHGLTRIRCTQTETPRRSATTTTAKTSVE